MSVFEDISVVEDMRLLGNSLFKAEQYRRAEQVYKNGLALMDLSLDKVCITGPPFSGHITSTRAAMPLSVQDNLTAATLLVNLAQAVLSGSALPDAAREAFYLTAWAESHLAAVKSINLAEPTHVTAEEVQWQEQQYSTLLEKAFMRKAMALERCADPAGALAAYTRCTSNLAMERTEEMLGILENYHSRKNGILMRVPDDLKEWMSPHRYWKYLATLGHWAVNVTGCDEGWEELGPMRAAYSCGVLQEGHALVMTRFKSKDSSCDANIDYYFLCRLTPDSDSFQSFPLGTDTGSLCDTAAMLNEKLYCVSLRDDPYMKVWEIRVTGGNGNAVKIPIVEMPIGCDLQLRRLFAGLVECCGDLYMFGGLVIDLEENAEAKGDMLRFVHNHDDLVECSVYCEADGAETMEQVSCPHPRFGHATFVHGRYIYIFGGITGRTSSDSLMPGIKLGPYLDDLWCLDVKTKEWRQLEPLGVRPSPRAFMGVGCNGKRTVIFGGEALRDGYDKTYSLADMWEFDLEDCTWTPIMPSPTEDGCLAARKSPGVALVSNGDVRVFCGNSNRYHRKPGTIDCVHLTIDRSKAMKSDTYRRRKRPPNGAWRDALTEEMCKLRVTDQLWSGTSEKERLLMSAPAGSVLVFTTKPAELAQCALTPADVANPSFRKLLRFRFAFCPTRIGPLWLLDNDGGHRFSCHGSPFDAAPRWMTPPSEITTKIIASTGKFLEVPFDGGCCWALWQSVKHFSTVKAAVLFFRMHLPKIGWDQVVHHWRRMKDLPLFKDTQRLLEWGVTELSVFYTIKEKKGYKQRLLMAQYFIMIVFGRFFVCVLADVPVLPHMLSRMAKLNMEVAENLIRMQHELLTQPSVNLRPACQHCGKSDPPPNTVENSTSQVCKGCRLVRFCGQKCQQADWNKHRTVCKKVAAGRLQVDELWTAENPD
ncbi:probable leucine-zipper-like transcriptional regulator 1 at N-terminal half [Coccomyxa sp. Obi]|nr:probable leucine-zipper-like transcriptional regulator 1 at N-terminal half [Coccomyxa sp. Obi]